MVGIFISIVFCREIPRQTVHILIRYHILWLMNWVCTVCTVKTLKIGTPRPTTVVVLNRKTV